MSEKTIRKELEAICNDLKQLQADTVKLKDDSMELTSDMVKTARERLEKEAEKLLKRLQDSAGELKLQGQATIGKVEKQIEEMPLISLLAATGLGFAIGWLVSRK